MEKLVVCTTGTSIGTNCGVDRDLLFMKNLGWDDVSTEILLKLEHCLKEKDLHDPETRRALSAELKSLDLLGLDSRDRVALLVTDTYQGRVCAEAVKNIITDAYGLADNQVELHRIEGLQVKNAKRLREQGLKNMIKVILQNYLNDNNYKYGHEIVFNPTGGFKGVVPFMTVLGMLYGKKTIYVFENSNELIELPPLPFSFDLKIYDRVKSALQFIDEEVAVGEQEYLSKIRDYTSGEHELFMAFTEPFDDNSITLSPLAYCLLPQGQREAIPLVSDKVLKTLEKCRDYSGIELRKMILNSTDPLWRQQRREKWVTTDLTILRNPRRPERLAGFMRDNEFHVVLAFSDHQDYERELPNYKIKGFQNENFTPWQAEENIELDDDIINCQKKNDKLSKEKNQLRKDKQVLDNKLSKAKKDAQQYEQEASYLSTKLSGYNHESEQHAESIEELGKELLAARANIDMLEEQASLNETLIREVGELKTQLDKQKNKGFVNCIKSIFKASSSG